MRNSAKLALVCSLALAVPLLGRADPPDFLILHNGAALMGHVSFDGETYTLRSPSGTGESRYAAKAVAKVCKGPLEAYTFLKQSATLDDPLERCRLARFCLSHDLFAEARVELDAAVELEPRCPEAKALRAQLTRKKNKPAQSEPVIPALPQTPVTPIPPAKLDDWPLALTPAGSQDYSRRIQPVLLQSCGTGACHGVPEGKRGFLLSKGLYGAPPSLVMTQTNFARVLGLLNKEAPETSLLLEKSREKHGGAKAPPLDHETYVALRNWVMTMSGKVEVTAKAEARETPVLGAPASAPPAFAAGNDAASSPPSTGSSLPPIPGVSAARQVGRAEQRTESSTPIESVPATTTGGLPKIPGIMKAAEQMGLKPSSPPSKPTPPAPASKSDGNRPPTASQPADPKDNPAFRDYARTRGHVPPLPNVTKAPPEQIRIQNAGTVQTAYPSPPDIPNDVFERLQRQASQKNDAKDTGSPRVPFLRGGEPVNPPPRQ
jgi:hypothetical protein